KWVGEDGAIVLYHWNADTSLFEPVSLSLLTGRAAIEQDDLSVFRVRFSGQAAPAVQVEDEAGPLLVTGLSNDVALEKPRLEIWQGARRLLAVGISGTMYAFTFEDEGIE